MVFHRIILLMLMLAPFRMVFAEDILNGIWSGNDRASNAIYYKVKIERGEISWGGGNSYNPPCSSQYIAGEVKDVSNYPDNIRSKVNPNGYKLLKIKIRPNSCTSNNGYFQFAIYADKPSYAEVVVYDVGDKMVGWHNFSKELP